jgi:hypothetical protein
MKQREIIQRVGELVAAVREQLDEIDRLLPQLKRRSPKKRAPRVSTPMTVELRKEIVEYAAANPEASQHVIAEHMGTNQGRISEALRGLRK